MSADLGEAMMWHRRLAAGYVCLILVLTLLPGPATTALPEELPSTLCLVCGERGVADGILNILFFLPLGFTLMAAGGRPLRVLGLIAAMSIAIEALQGIIPGRYSNLGDVLYNAVGGGAGIALAAMRGQLFWPNPRFARLLTLGSGAAAAMLLFLGGVLLAPSFPATIYYGQWTADLHHLEAYEGRVLEASIGSMLLESQKMANPEMAVELLRSGARLDALVVAGPAPPALAPIVSIFDESEDEVLLFGVDVTDLVLRLRYRANDFRLDRPDLRFRGAFTLVRPGDTIALKARIAPEGYILSLDQREIGPLRHTPGEGWALFLHPERTPPWLDFLLNATWVGGLLILVGWWAPGPVWAAGGLAIALAGMVMAGVTGSFTGVAGVEILAAIGGVLLGAVLRASAPRVELHQPPC